MGILSAAISHLLGGDGGCRPQRRQRSGASPGPATGAPQGVRAAGIGVRLASEWVFGFARNRCSTWPGARNRAMEPGD